MRILVHRALRPSTVRGKRNLYDAFLSSTGIRSCDTVLCSRFGAPRRCLSTSGGDRTPPAGCPSDDVEDTSFLHLGPELPYPKDQILKASLPFVLETGWTHHAIGAGAESIGLSRASHGLFERGGAELLEYFLRSCNLRLAESLSADGLREANLPVPVKVKRGIETRLRLVSPFLSVWPQAIALGTDPRNSPHLLRIGAEAMDEIWYHAGDSSIDFSWYTKRATLGGIYTATELYMVQDTSVDFRETWEFLDRRLADVGTLGSAKKDVSQGLELLAATVQSLMGTYRPRS